MEINESNSSMDYFSNKSFDHYRDWLDLNLRLGKLSSLFALLHLVNFLKLHSSSLGIQKFVYMEKLFDLAVELKLKPYAEMLLSKFLQEFGKDEPKIQRMIAYLFEIDSEQMKNAAQTYKKLIRYNQEDKQSLKKYLAFIKPFYMADNLKKYVEMWNEYLKVYMDDVDGWWELSDIYIQTQNLPKAIYCLEEVLLHLPNNYEIYTKVGDTLVSLNNSDSAKVAVKYYSQSILIKPSPRSFWGLVYCLNIIYKANKDLDHESKNLLKIAKINLENFYSTSPFKITVDQFFDIRA
jgi:tetratricopeptide (TPR) repeat protein